MRLKTFLLATFLFALSHANVLCQQNPDAAKPAKSVEVYFDFGKHELRPDADSALNQVLTFLKSRENYSIKITAHTDSIGSLANNLALSERRAKSVKNFLVQGGVEPARVSFNFFGEKLPVSNNDSEAGRQKNRRATIDVLLAKPMVTIEGVVTDENTGKPLVADVIFRTKEGSDSVRTAEDGRFKKMVNPGTVVGIDAFANCHFSKTEMVKALAKTPPVSLPLKPATSGAILDIENLYFVGDQPVILESSKPELPKILRFMKQNPSMKIEIAGHVNLPNRPPVTEAAWEFKLSQERAKTVYYYLLDNGIASDRISWKGYGNHEMRFPNARTEEEQAMNRRVEMRVLEGGCGD